MTDHTLLSDPQEVIGREWNKNPSSERRQLLELARDALFFISDTGQRHDREDFRESLKASASHLAAEVPIPSNAEKSTTLEERLRSTRGLFTELRDEPVSTKERELIQIILDTLDFISVTRQRSAFSDYREHVAADGPPYVMASFATQEEAEAWLQHHPHPPASSNILIANRYHDVVYDPATNLRTLPRNLDLEYYLAWFQREHPPAAIAAFSNLEAADAWLQSHPKPARWAWVLIAGEFYLAVHYLNIGHRALHALSLAKTVDPGGSPQGRSKSS